MNERLQELNWARLLREIRREHVVPVVGPELLPYYGSLALQLAKHLEVGEVDGATDVSAVAEAHVARGGNMQAALDALDELLRKHSHDSEWIDQLVRIDEFRLILTTDFDSTIERALHRRKIDCDTLAYAPQSRFDDLTEYPQRPTVYHLFGHFERLGRVALAKVDQLEYLYRLQTHAGPVEIFDVLRERKNILFLGCDFPEWLTAFFTRILVGNPLYETRMRGMEVIANRNARDTHAPSSLTAFLRQNRVEIYPGDARQFIADLNERYTPPASPNTRSAAKPPLASRGHVFVSYSRKNTQEVRRFVEALRVKHIDVWFDERELEPGDVFNNEIKFAIQEDAAAFIPIISRRALDTDRSYFVREWKWALESQREYFLDAKFVFPVVVDDGDADETLQLLARAFGPFAELHVERCPSGANLSDRLVHELREARKRFERSKRGAA